MIKKSQYQSPLCNYETHFKRCVPLVSLGLDGTSKKALVVESTDENVYVKLSQSSVSLFGILSAIGNKVSIPPDDLILLDAKLIPVSDEKGQLTVYMCK